MTVAADLQTNAQRAYFLRIAGLDRNLWTSGDHPDATGAHTGPYPPGPVDLADESLVGYWPLDELSSSATSAYDRRGTLNLTMAGTVPVQAGMLTEIAGTGARGAFSDANYFYRNDEPLFRPPQVTIAAWVYPNATPLQSKAVIATKDYDGAGNGSSYGLTADSTGTKFRFSLYDGSTSYEAVDSSAFSATTWYRVVGTCDGTNAILYVNGVSVATATLSSGSIGYDSRPFFVGDLADHGASPPVSAGFYFDGRLQHVALYSAPKSAEWVRRDYAAAVAYGRVGIPCLRVPEIEHHVELDLATMRSQLSAMTFELDDVEDYWSSHGSTALAAGDGTRYFGKMFAPGRFLSNANFTYIRRADADDVQIDADATYEAAKRIGEAKTGSAIIHVLNNGAVAAGNGFKSFIGYGLAHIGRETFAYTGTSTASQTGFTTNETLATFTGVTKGVYPAFDNPRGSGTKTFGYTYRHPQFDDDLEGSTRGAQTVSDVPLTWIGRDVGLYVTTWDETTAQWNTSPSLVWAGRIESLEYDPVAASWKVACNSLLDAILDRKIGGNGPSAHARLINLNGDRGRSFVLMSPNASNGILTGLAWAQVTVSKNYYTYIELLIEVGAQLRAASWTGLTPSGYWGMVAPGWPGDASTKNPNADVAHLEYIAPAADESWYLLPYGLSAVAGAATPQVDHSNPCLALRALGFTEERFYRWDVASGKRNFLSADEPVYTALQPATYPFNGGEMFVTEVRGRPIWGDQGDLSSASAVVWTLAKKDSGGQDGDIPSSFAYTALAQETNSGVDGTKLTLAVWARARPAPGEGLASFAGVKGGVGIPVYNVVLPEYQDANYVPVGPFKHILYVLASTGTKGYNDSTYDVYPLEAALSVPIALLDVQSFTDADAAVLGNGMPDLAFRRFAPLGPKAISFGEWAQRECQLFGYALVWRDGKIACKQIFSPELQSASITLSDSSGTSRHDWPPIMMSPDTVLNRRAYELDHDYATDKHALEFEITDEESIDALGIVKSVTCKHPGVWTRGVPIDASLEKLATAQLGLTSFPWHVVKWTLNPYLFNRVFVGDVVAFTPSFAYPDPFGSGSMSASTKALVIDIAWNLQSGAGTCTLLVWSRYTAAALPYAPAALIDVTHTTGGFTRGWDQSNKYLRLVDLAFGYNSESATDNDDGSAFASGDKVRIQARAPSDPTSLNASTEGPWSATVASAYETDGTQILTLTTDPFSGGGLNANYEFVVTFDDYGTVGSSEKTRGSWQAAYGTHLLNGADVTHRWG